jgi:hypothetical protein
VGDRIRVGTQYRIVDSIASDTSLNVTVAFTEDQTSVSGTVYIWDISVSDGYVSSEQSVTVSNINCFDALALANTIFSANYIIRNRTIRVGTAGIDVATVFGYGKGNGLKSIRQTTNNDSGIITRLRVFGSTKNIPYRWYNNQINPSTNLPYIQDSMYVPNLVLPNFLSNGGDSYIDATADDIVSYVDLYGVREGIVFFDGSDDREEIYPSIQGMTYAQLVAAGVAITQEVGDNGNLDEIYSVVNPTDNGILPDDGTELEKTFTIVLKDLGFDLSEKLSDGSYKYASSDGEMTISMKSGNCVGREFSIVDGGIKKVITSGVVTYELVCNREQEDAIGMAFPNSNYRVLEGDKFVIVNIQMPDAYVYAAMQRLLAAGSEYLAANNTTKFTYEPDIDNIYMARNPSIGLSLKEGDIFNFEDLDLPISDSVIIKTLEIVEGSSLIPQYSVILSNEYEETGISKIRSEISKIKGSIPSWDSSSAYAHYHRNKSLIDLINQTNIDVLGHLSVVEGEIQSDIDFYFLQGLKSGGNTEFGDFVSGMLTGKGGQVDARGNAEFQSAVIRGSMKVMDLLINRLYAIESDYVYTEADTVEEVEEVGDKTYRLTLRRKYDGYFTAQKENNVLFGVINSLANGSGGEYYTAWSRVLSVNTTDNTITVVMYPDNEVPDGVNYPPTKGMVLARKGNSDSPLDGSHNERQDFWSMSSSDGRLLFLQNVAKPILEEYYYTLSIGKLPELEKFKALPIGKDDTAVYAKNIVAENYYQIDASGNVQTQEVYRGAWSADVAASDQPYRRIVNDVTTPTGSTSHVLAVHTVYHRGCKWACLTDMTTLEPKWNSSAWQFLEGDSNYSIRFSAYPSERVRINAVNMVITAQVYYGNLDVTDELLALPGTDIQWTRNSGIIPEDNAWHPALGVTKNILNITNQDMATNWLTVQRVGFVITVFIPTGDGTYYRATDELPLTI